ncbi:MAG: response regulator transcription factor [Chloroflexi bacterium]|nr:response regulator transcription factor [Chloroflexota bacterium]
MKLLVIEDDKGIVEALSFTFQVGWPESALVVSYKGRDGVALVQKERPDVIIIDLGLPDISGFDVIRAVREFSLAPILVLTVNLEETDVARAFSLGADDYVVKPFRPLELMARVRSLKNRLLKPRDEQTLTIGDITLETFKRVIHKDGQIIHLTNAECIILKELIINSPNVVSNTRLADEIWGCEYSGATDSIKVHVNHLRQKIEDVTSSPRYIKTASGIGYFMTV